MPGSAVDVRWGEASPVRDPAKLMRVAQSAVAVSSAADIRELDEATRIRLAQLWDRVLDELVGAVSDSAMTELRRLLPPGSPSAPTGADLRLTQALIVGWLKGIFLAEAMRTWTRGIAVEQDLARSLSTGISAGRRTPEQDQVLYRDLGPATTISASTLT